MKKRFMELLKRSKKTFMVSGMYLLLVAGMSLGVVGCSTGETVSAETKQEAASKSAKKKDAKNTAKTKADEVKEEKNTHGEDEVEEIKEEAKSSSDSTSDSTTKSAAKSTAKKTTTSDSSAKKTTSKTNSTTSKNNSSNNSTSSSATASKNETSKKETTTSKNESKVETTSKKEETSSTSSTNKKEEEKHTHSWEPVYKEVDKGYYKQELVKAAWTEEIPQYTMIYRTFCNGCGLDITDCVTEHTKSQMLAGNFACGGYTDKPVKTQIGTKIVEHPAEYKDVWVSNIVKEVDYYKCSCGATK